MKHLKPYEPNPKLWWHQMDAKIDLVPCPHCLEPCYMDTFDFDNFAIPARYSCRNERCFQGGGRDSLKYYYKEFKFVLERVKDGYKYPKKVIEFAQQMSMKVSNS